MAGNGQGDVASTAWHTIFIPEAVDTIVDGAQNDGHPLVAERYSEYTSISIDPNTEWDWPWTKVYLLFGLPWLLLAWLRPRGAMALHGLMGLAAGSCYILFWVLSDYDFYHRNWNLALFPPTHLLLVWASFKGSQWRASLTRGYLVAHAAVVLLVGLLHATGVIAQAIGPMWVLAMTMTAVLWVRGAMER